MSEKNSSSGILLEELFLRLWLSLSREPRNIVELCGSEFSFRFNFRGLQNLRRRLVGIMSLWRIDVTVPLITVR